MTRDQAITALKRVGIEAEEIYLIDVLPIVEMIWADGRAQEAEITLLDDYLTRHVSRLNAQAGCEVLTVKQARNFVLKYLKKRPDFELLKTLRSLVAPVRLSLLREEERKKITDTLLWACLDVAASSVREYPYGLHDRFDPAEKQCLFEVLDSLTG